MSQWNNSPIANSQKFEAGALGFGSGRANIAGNNVSLYGNTTPGAFGKYQNVVIISVTGTTNTFSNTDTLVLSNGSINGLVSVSTTATGNISNSSLTIKLGGEFPIATTNGQVVVTALAANGAASNGLGATFVANLGTVFVNDLAVGVFPVSVAMRANTSGEGSKVGSPGWNLRRAWEGPLMSFTATSGSGFANGEGVTFSNGTVNATGILTSNATGNLVSGVIPVNQGGMFTNAAIVVATLQRQQHLFSNATVAGASVTGGSGYSNTDTLLFSNGTVNGTATISTNTTGGFTNSGITLTNVGLWSNVATNSSVVVVALAANGAPSAGTSATLVPYLATSATGTITVANSNMGGRAGRVQYECLVHSRSMVNAGMYVSNVFVTGSTASFTNTDYIIVSNGTINAYATISTNSTGGITNTSISISLANGGLVPTGTANSTLVVNAYASNGAVSNGTTATFTAGLTNSSVLVQLPHA